ncbi:hypothetical protein [Klenkia taihuensis]|uniref:Uncharacterized protein n=1 Tax=Klenkia taihuensis TaxID=1225127 RepID=A0A1I1UPU3_9ACTN|nr:hypothetical protein [Klenkia taihuensis]GHE13942.1 hypothetical protein GCM10011381_38210 [Klenkia taihuensis]SFD72831.1 hypothetical protein SAMN05661030_4093 [Klenkia taihuensis]
MDYLRRLQMERPVLYFIVLLVGFWVALQLVLFIARVVLGPFGLPGWAPLALVLVVAVVVARRQNR